MVSAEQEETWLCTRHHIVIFGDEHARMDNRQRLSMDQHYVEITTRIRSLRNFCNFLTTAVIRDQPEGAPWRDITAAMMERERRELGQLERLRSRLYPDLAEEDISPPLYSH